MAHVSPRPSGKQAALGGLCRPTNCQFLCDEPPLHGAEPALLAAKWET